MSIFNEKFQKPSPPPIFYRAPHESYDKPWSSLLVYIVVLDYLPWENNDKKGFHIIAQNKTKRNIFNCFIIDTHIELKKCIPAALRERIAIC